MSSPPPTNLRKLRIVCISDTHNHSPGEGYTLPAGDVLIHAGDLTNQGSLAELRKAAAWLDQADFAAKIVVAGNHDLGLDPDYRLKHAEGWNVAADEGEVEECRALMRGLRGVTYLEHEAATVKVAGLGVEVKVFGSPFSAESRRQNWAFQYPEADAEGVWRAVPEGVDVLVTHTPPRGRVDASKHWEEGGCPALAQAIECVRPRLHVCGHCHEGRGAEIVHWSEGSEAVERVEAWRDPGMGSKKQSLLDMTGLDPPVGLSSTTAVVNASIMAKSWGQGTKQFNKPIVVDMLFPTQEGS